jgi:hypothetical protein
MQASCMNATKNVTRLARNKNRQRRLVQAGCVDASQIVMRPARNKKCPILRLPNGFVLR